MENTRDQEIAKIDPDLTGDMRRRMRNQLDILSAHVRSLSDRDVQTLAISEMEAVFYANHSLADASGASVSMEETQAATELMRRVGRAEQATQIITRVKDAFGETGFEAEVSLTRK